MAGGMNAKVYWELWDMDSRNQIGSFDRFMDLLEGLKQIQTADGNLDDLVIAAVKEDVTLTITAQDLMAPPLEIVK